MNTPAVRVGAARTYLMVGSARGFTNVRGGLPARLSTMMSSHTFKSQIMIKQ